MIGRACIAGAIALALLSNASPAGTMNDEYPPVRFQRNSTIILTFHDDINDACGIPPKGYRFLGCARGNRVAMPSPCRVPGERYAKTLCHELGHANGWSAKHED